MRAVFWFICFLCLFFQSVKKVNGSLMGIALNLLITLGNMAIFTILILPNHEHGIFFHLFVFSLISLSSGLHFSLKRSFTSLVRCIPRYFILFVAIMNGSSLMIWLSGCYWCIGMLVTLHIGFVFWDFTEVAYQLKEILGWDDGPSKYTVMSSANRDNLTYFFPNRIPFISFSCLIALARTSILYWIGVMREGILV